MFHQKIGKLLLKKIDRNKVPVNEKNQTAYDMQ